jgi:hypothetical protein
MGSYHASQIEAPLFHALHIPVHIVGCHQSESPLLGTWQTTIHKMTAGFPVFGPTPQRLDIYEVADNPLARP